MLYAFTHLALGLLSLIATVSIAVAFGAALLQSDVVGACMCLMLYGIVRFITKEWIN